jgi:hypothetical protein
MVPLTHIAHSFHSPTLRKVNTKCHLFFYYNHGKIYDIRYVTSNFSREKIEPDFRPARGGIKPQVQVWTDPPYRRQYTWN